MPAVDRAIAWILLAALCGLTLAVCLSSLTPLGAVEVVVFALCLACAARVAFRASAAPLDWRFGALAALPAWGCLQLLLHTTIYRFATWSGVLLFASYAGAYFVARQSLHARPVSDLFRAGCLGFGFLLAIEAILQRLAGNGAIFWILRTDLTPVAMGPFVNYDHFSALMELLMPLALWRALTEPSKAVRYLVMAATMFASIVTSASRVGFAIGSGELLFFLVLALKQKRSSLGTLAAAFIFGSFVAAVGGEFLLQRLQNITYDDRLRFDRSGLSMIRERPWTGFGLGTWQWAYPPHAVFDAGGVLDHAHNDWIEWAATGGIPFAALLLAFAAGSIERSSWKLGIVAVCLHSAADFPLQEPAVFYFWILLAALPPVTPRVPAKPSTARAFLRS